MWRSTILVLASCLTLACGANAWAQGGPGGGGRGGHGPGGGPGGGGGRGMDPAMQAGGNPFNQGNQGNLNQMQMGPGMQNQNQSQNMPTISQLATSLMSTYDTDSSGALDITELQAALAGLRSLMMSNGQQNGNAGGANAGAMNQQAMQPPRRR